MSNYDTLNYREDGGATDHIGGTLQYDAGGVELRTTADSITAHAGGGQASATALTAQHNRVTTVATAADSVKLPASAAGLVIEVHNDASANSLQLYGAGTDTINGAAAATGVAVAAGKTARLVCYTAGAWVGPIALA